MDNKNIFAKNLQRLMDENNKKRREVCEALGFNYYTFSDWVNGKKYPRMPNVEKLANYFGVKISDLIERHITINGEIPVPKEGYLPILGKVSAGLGVYACEDVLGYEYADMRYCNDNYFYLKVTGDSMTPEIKDGDLVLVHKQESVNSGNYAVVIVDDEEGCVKQVKYDSETIELHSVNPYYPIREFKKEDTKRVRIVGRVIEAKRKF